MTEHDPKPVQPSTRRLSALVGVVGALVGIAAGSIVIGKAIYGGGSTPALHANATPASGARRIASFLDAQDGKLVYLEIECDDYGTNSAFGKLDPHAHCYVEEKENLTESSKRGFQFWLFPNSAGEPGSDFSSQMQIDVPESPEGTSGFADANKGNASSGAGGLVAKGYFYVTITGSGSLGPPGIKVAELHPTVPGASER